jgi:hypothetical protein
MALQQVCSVDFFPTNLMAPSSSSSGYQDSHPLLPRIPSEPLSHEDFKKLSAEIIDAYSKIRFTTPYPRTLGIDKVKIQFPTATHQITSSPPECEPDRPKPSETLQDGLSGHSPSPEASEIKKCFLHPKPKPNCHRCKAYLEYKLNTKGIAPLVKKHRYKQ